IGFELKTHFSFLSRTAILAHFRVTLAGSLQTGCEESDARKPHTRSSVVIAGRSPGISIFTWSIPIRPGAGPAHVGDSIRSCSFTRIGPGAAPISPVEKIWSWLPTAAALEALLADQSEFRTPFVAKIAGANSKISMASGALFVPSTVTWSCDLPGERSEDGSCRLIELSSPDSIV